MAGASDNPFAGLGDNAEAGNLRQHSITDQERLILTNLFDTQPKRRAEYLKQIGFEMDPRNNNHVRPLGSPSDSSYNVEIDPGGFRQYLPELSLKGIKKGSNELGLDIGDLASDLQKGSLIGAGAAGGAAIGSAGGPLAILGAVLGGALGSYAAEEAKKQVGDIFLDNKIPNDHKLQIVGSVIDGVIPEVAKTGGSLAKGLLSQKLNASRQAAVNALKGSGGVANQELIDYAVKNPAEFTAEKVAGANKGYIDTFKKFFGLEPEQFSKEVTDFSRIPKDSVFGAQIQPLKTAADSEIAKLAANPNASVNGAQITSQLQGTINDLSAKPFRTEIEDNALKTAKGLLNDVVTGAKQITGNKDLTAQDLSQVSFNYGQARSLLKRVQDKAFDQGAFGSKSENPIVSSIAGKARQQLDQVAVANGSSLPQINAAQSDILNTFRKAQTQLSPEKLFQAYTGNSKTASQEIKDFVTNEIDNKYGTNWGEDFTDAAAKKYFEGVFKNTATKGSEAANKAIAAEAYNQAKLGAVAGAGTGGTIGGAIGGLPGAGIGASLGGIAGGLAGKSRGAAQGALNANPELALGAISNIDEQIAQPHNYDELGQAIGSFVTPQVSRLATPFLPKTEEDNPFKGLGD